jgi:Tol biopolymer transport system component
MNWLRVFFILPGILMICISGMLFYSRLAPSEARLVAHSDFFSSPSDIYLRVPGRTVNTYNLTHHPAVDTQPTWSPDGQWIAFVSDREQPRAQGLHFNNVYVVHPNGTGLRKLGISSPATGTRVVTWSPDGQWLYVKYITRGWWDTYFVRIADGYTQSLRFSSTFNMAASWSPDGQWLAFRTGLDDDAMTAIGRARPGDGDAMAVAQILTRTSDYIDTLLWSPDSQYIAFTSFERQMSAHFFLAVMRSDGSNLRRLSSSDFPYIDYAWSPDGRQLTFITGVPGTSTVYQMALDNARAQPLIGPDNFKKVAWSPDGRWLVLVVEIRNTGEIYRLDTDGSNLKRLWQHDRPIGRISWSADGRWLYATTGARGQSQLYRIRPDGSQAQYLTDVGFEWELPLSPVINFPWRGWLLLVLGILPLGVAILPVPVQRSGWGQREGRASLQRSGPAGGRKAI